MQQQQQPQPRGPARAFIATLPTDGVWQVHRVGAVLFFVDATAKFPPFMLFGDSLAALGPTSVPVMQEDLTAGL
jgi:hypothetical protein